MTGEHAEDIGKLKADNKRTMDNIDNLFKSNEKRKSEINKSKLEFQSIQHTVEETNQTANKVVEFMEELKKSVDSVKTYVVHIDERVTALENNRFDSVKVLRWLSTVRGTIFMISVSAMLIGAIFPDAREWISSLFNLATRAAQ